MPAKAPNGVGSDVINMRWAEQTASNLLRTSSYHGSSQIILRVDLHGSHTVSAISKSNAAHYACYRCATAWLGFIMNLGIATPKLRS